MKKLVLVVGILIALGIATNANAQKAECSKKKCTVFEKIDVNKDQKLSLEEFTSFREEKRHKTEKKAEEVFADLDTNKDGFVTPEEFAERKNIRKKAIFDKIDKDGNGTISFEEFKAFEPKHPRGERPQRRGRHHRR